MVLKPWPINEKKWLAVSLDPQWRLCANVLAVCRNRSRFRRRVTHVRPAPTLTRQGG
jgi:hypothetical protein